MTSYENKYIKYKLKYLILKKQYLSLNKRKLSTINENKILLKGGDTNPYPIQNGEYVTTPESEDDDYINTLESENNDYVNTPKSEDGEFIHEDFYLNSDVVVENENDDEQ